MTTYLVTVRDFESGEFKEAFTVNADSEKDANDFITRVGLVLSTESWSLEVHNA